MPTSTASISPYDGAKVTKPETQLESLINQFEKSNAENSGFTNRLDSLADRLRSEPVEANPNKEQLKNPISGLISRLCSLLDDYGRMIGKNMNTLEKLESLL